MKRFHCESCGREVETRTVKREEEFPVKGEPVKVLSSVRICADCGEDLSDKDLDSATLRAAYDVYRRQHNIISPDEIAGLRQRYGLSQRGLGALLGWGEITVHRYENGSLPDKAHNDMLRLLSDPKNMARIFAENSHRLPGRVRKKAASRLESLKNDEESAGGPRSPQRSKRRPRPSVYSGFRLFSADTLEAMIVFFASQPGGVLKTKLNKMLWYADFLHYRMYSVSISGATYIHLPFGPVPSKYERHLSSLISNNVVTPQEKKFSDEITGENLVSEQAPDPGSLPDTALPVLKAVWQRFENMGSACISELSHEEDGYKETQQSEPISYEYAERLKVEFPIEGIE
jgi:putative zinc finger/helix-turn-helix YgiT family protein